ncbi:hypothetical protein UFOVP393_83 [uncultured Caudovirales phage]|jgi:hypothetical protein|uniref:Uncharacterized protein n=1 Tax=uncultured Caudovirales phage TaxID=2100421 RepID=A0A6J7X4Z5_9CAUD|nr:hypothetical protein UFOVP393_83 [uncultured Caudovirales phage]
MPANKKPRKKYRGPRMLPGEMPTTIRHSDESDTLLQMVPHVELDKFREGNADAYTVNTLAFRLGWGYVMAGEYFDTPEARKTMEDGLGAIRGVKERFGRTKKYGASQPEFQAIGVALSLTDEMQKMTTRREQRDAVRKLRILNDFKKANP